jgi:anti-sigma factor ChrR (cupin superfamily)
MSRGKNAFYNNNKRNHFRSHLKASAQESGGTHDTVVVLAREPNAQCRRNARFFHTVRPSEQINLPTPWRNAFFHTMAQSA